MLHLVSSLPLFIFLLISVPEQHDVSRTHFSGIKNKRKQHFSWFTHAFLSPYNRFYGHKPRGTQLPMQTGDFRTKNKARPWQSYRSIVFIFVFVFRWVHKTGTMMTESNTDRGSYDFNNEFYYACLEFLNWFFVCLSIVFLLFNTSFRRYNLLQGSGPEKVHIVLKFRWNEQYYWHVVLPLHVFVHIQHKLLVYIISRSQFHIFVCDKRQKKTRGKQMFTTQGARWQITQKKKRKIHNCLHAVLW